MLDLEAIKDTIYDWVNGQTLVDPDDITYQFQNAAFANKPAFSLRIMSLTQIGDSDLVVATSGNSDERDIVTTWDFVLEILGFGTGIVGKTQKLINSLNSPAVHDQLKAGGVITFNNSLSVLDISGLNQNENEERSSYDASMRTFEAIENFPVGQISIVNGLGTFKQPGKPDFTRTLNIDSTI